MAKELTNGPTVVLVDADSVVLDTFRERPKSLTRHSRVTSRSRIFLAAKSLCSNVCEEK
jgi:hypothetical protein